MQAIDDCEKEVPPVPLNPIRFDVNDTAAWHEFLNTQGFVVIAGVADPQQVQAARQLFWEWIESTNMGVKRNDVNTWHRWPGMRGTGIFFSHGIGQSEFLWFLRGLPAVKKAFAQVWGTDDLITSFDGANAFRPWSVDPDWRTMGSWYHTDQNGITKPGLHMVQGLVSLYDSTAETGGFVAVPQSQQHHRQVCERAGATEKTHDFVKMVPNDPVLNLCPPPSLICARAGDLILWDSRTIHCNCPGIVPPTSTFARIRSYFRPAQVDLLRLVGYICMCPRSAAPPEVLEERKNAFKNQVTTNHWPTTYQVTSTCETPRTFELSAEQLALV
eukprot:c17829_g1_i1.p1 GENE.c17829_g1_i1~~c17829_g1_i1.p1  ORF type:complete len:329 (-),score=50.83 c17829_g1_i1:43-1029(-)